MRRALASLLCAGLALGAGCDADELEIADRRVVQAPRQVGLPSLEDRLGMGEIFDRQEASPAGALRPAGGEQPRLPFAFETPPGWEPRPATEFRLLNFGVPGGGECYVSVLPSGGGGLLANVNRWRSQIGAPPLDEAGLAGLPRQPLLGHPAVWVELTGTYQGGSGEPPRAGWAVQGLLLDEGGGLVTVKLIGPEDVVAAQHEALLGFSASLRVE